MPLRRRVAFAPEVVVVNSKVFEWGDGTWSYFPNQSVYRTRETAERAWRRARREVWANCRRYWIPRAAEAYDGLTRAGSDRLWSGWQQRPFPLAAVLESLNDDRVAVADFRAEDPRAAHAIGDFLDLWLEILRGWEDLAREVAEAPEFSIPTGRFHSHKGTYGDAVRAQNVDQEADQ